MATKNAEDISLLPLIELFGTFFDKITSKHPYKDPLRKELAEFKDALYTSQNNNIHNVDSYLEHLLNKPVIPKQTQSPSRIVSTTFDTSSGSQLPTQSVNNRSSNTSSYYKSGNSGVHPKKIDLVPLLDFMKYRTLGQSDKKQALLSRYSHVQSLEKDPSNLYKLFAINWFVLLIRSPSAGNNLSNIVDEVAAKRIHLACTADNLTHENLSGVFCGFFSQLVRMKRQQESLAKILDTFYEMVAADKIFGVSLACFVKAKIYLFVEQKNLPYEIVIDSKFKAMLQSKYFKERVEGDDLLHLDSVLRLVPFVLEKRLVAYIVENGKIVENVYKPAITKKQEEEPEAPMDEEGLGTIHLLVEKVFSSISIFGLVPHSLSASSTRFRSPFKQPTSVTNLSARESLQKPIPTSSPALPRRNSKVKVLTIDTAFVNSPKSAMASMQVLSASYNASNIASPDSRYLPASAKLPPNTESPTKNFNLNFTGELAKGLRGEKKAFNYEYGNTSAVNESSSYRESQCAEKENDYSGGLSPTKIGVRAPYRKEINTRGRMEADEYQQPQSAKVRYNNPPISNRSFNVASPTNSSNPKQTPTNASFTESTYRNKFTPSTSYQPRPQHAKTNSFHLQSPQDAKSSFFRAQQAIEYAGEPSQMRLGEEIPDRGVTKHHSDTQVLRKLDFVSRGPSYFGMERNASNQNQVSEANPDPQATSLRVSDNNEGETYNYPPSASPYLPHSASAGLKKEGGNSGHGSPVFYQTKEKLKNIISMAPAKTTHHIPTSSFSLQANSPTHARPSYSYYSGYGTNTSYTNPTNTSYASINYQNERPSVGQSGNMSSRGAGEQAEQKSNYQLDTNFSYQAGHITTQRPNPNYSYTPNATTPLANPSQNTSFSASYRSSVPYKPYTGTANYQYNPIPSQMGESSQKAANTKNTSTSFGHQMAALSTNTSFNTNIYIPPAQNPSPGQTRNN